MTSVYAIQGWQDFAAFAAWALVVLAASTAIFRSFPAAEFRRWLDTGLRPERESVARLQFELTYGAVWTPATAQAINKAIKTADRERAVASAIQNSGAEQLDAAALGARRQKLARSVLNSRRLRALNYLMGCSFCQHFWVAATVYLLTVPAVKWWPGLGPSVLAYAAVAGAMMGLMGQGGATDPAQQQPPNRGGFQGGNCGQ